MSFSKKSIFKSRRFNLIILAFIVCTLFVSGAIAYNRVYESIAFPQKITIADIQNVCAEKIDNIVEYCRLKNYHTRTSKIIENIVEIDKKIRDDDKTIAIEYRGESFVREYNAIKLGWFMSVGGFTIDYYNLKYRLKSPKIVEILEDIEDIIKKITENFAVFFDAKNPYSRANARLYTIADSLHHFSDEEKGSIKYGYVKNIHKASKLLIVKYSFSSDKLPADSIVSIFFDYKKLVDLISKKQESQNDSDFTARAAPVSFGVKDVTLIWIIILSGNAGIVFLLTLIILFMFCLYYKFYVKRTDKTSKILAKIESSACEEMIANRK